MSAGADYDALAPEEDYIKKFPYDKDYLICEYLKEHKEPIIVNHSGRITYEN